MVNDFKKIFGDNISIEVLKEKPNVALFLAKRMMYQVEIENVSFVLIETDTKEKFGAAAFKKQLAAYEEKLQCKIAFSFQTITKAQRDALLSYQIPFVALPDQIYLPFLGILLSNKFKKAKEIKKEKMMPATQQLFLFLFYRKGSSVLKSEAADALRLTRTSITRASEQLLAMDLIEQNKKGKEIHMQLKYSSRKSIELASLYMINPVQSKITINKSDFQDKWLYSGETALGEYSMLNPPPIPEVAVYKGAIDKKNFIEVDVRWADVSSVMTIELWKYDPFLFALSDKVDPISLACSFRGMEDERVEMAVEEMLEEMVW